MFTNKWRSLARQDYNKVSFNMYKNTVDMKQVRQK